MSSLVGGTEIIGQDMVCGFGNGKYKTFESTKISIENCLKAKVKDLRVEGKTYQNLFKAELSQGHVGNSSTTYDLRVNSEGFSLEEKTYTLYINTNYQLLLYYDYVNTGSSYVSWTDKIVWTNSTKTNNIRIMVKKTDNSEITVDEVIGKIVLLEGDYTNIDLPNSINGIESVTERENNLVNTTTIYESMLESGTIGSLFNPKSNSAYDVYKMEIQPNTEYLFNLVGYGQTPWVRILDKNNITVKSQNLSSTGLNYIWSLKTESNFYYLVFNKPKTSTGEFKIYKEQNPYPLKLKINEENNYINLPIPLRSLPNGVADTIEGNKLVQRIGKVTLDGTEEMGFYNASNYIRFTIKMPTEAKAYNKRTAVYAKGYHFEDVKNEDKVIFSSAVEGANRLYIYNYDYKTVNDFKAHLTENPLEVYYELATPIIHDLEVPNISTTKGTNIITTSNNIKPKLSMKVKVK